MAFVFGMDLPVLEVMVFLIVVMIGAIAFMAWQIINVGRHIKVLEGTTLEIRKYEDAEDAEVKRFESDVKTLETDEAELFLAKTIPTVVKLQNYAASELMRGREPQDILEALIAKNVKQDLATKVVNSMMFYLDYHHKLPKKQSETHAKAAEQLAGKTGQ